MRNLVLHRNDAGGSSAIAFETTVMGPVSSARHGKIQGKTHTQYVNSPSRLNLAMVWTDAVLLLRSRLVRRDAATSAQSTLGSVVMTLNATGLELKLVIWSGQLTARVSGPGGPSLFQMHRRMIPRRTVKTESLARLQ
jgi:hypothetical protein